MLKSALLLLLVGFFVYCATAEAVAAETNTTTSAYQEVQGPSKVHHIRRGVVHKNDGAHHTRAATQLLTHAQLVNIYNIPWSASAGAGRTIAIVVAYGASTAESDLANFINRWFTYLPQCTTANGCFQKLDQNGGLNYPADDAGWGQEANLDLQTIHAIAPGARKIMVVANSLSFADLITAVQTAAARAQYVSMSFGSREFQSQTFYDANVFARYPQTTFIASSGDDATYASYPASSPNVIAVGGTTIFTNPDGSFAYENGWASAGGGCSAFSAAAPAQTRDPGYAAQGCGGRKSTPDVSFDADPASGVPIYTTPGCANPPNCFYQFGGTSLAAPIFAARSAIRGAVVNADFLYGINIQYRDVTTGGTALYPCTGGLDKVTGLGDWVGDRYCVPGVGSVLPSGGAVNTNDNNNHLVLQSSDCRFQFWLQVDGNLVLYQVQTNGGLAYYWASGVHPNQGPYTLAMQGDGNLVLYAGSGVPLWYSATYGQGAAPYNLIMQSDGNLVLYDTNFYPLWHTHTSGR